MSLIKITKNGNYNSVYLGGIKFDSVNYTQALELIKDYIIKVQEGEKFPNYIVTPHSEFIWKSFQDNNFKKIINNSFLSLADGISVLWLEMFFSFPMAKAVYKIIKFRALLFFLIWIESILTIFIIFFVHGKLNKFLKHRITGVDLLNKVFKYCSQNSFSIYLLGGFGNTSEMAANKIKSQFPNIRIAGYFSGTPRVEDECDIIRKILESKADLLIVAYSSIIEEEWIARNFSKINVPLSIGVGRSLDYIAGTRKKTPQFFRILGIELWYKLILDPKRFKRQMVFFKVIKESANFKYDYYKKK